MHLNPDVLSSGRIQGLAIDKLNTARDALALRLRPSVSALTEPIMPKLIWKSETLQQSALHRLIALFDGAALCWNERNGLAAILIARAMVETLAFTAAFTLELERVVAAKDLAKIDAVLMQYTFATKSDRLSIEAEYRSVNVLTLIKKLDRAIFPAETGGFFSCYDTLSEMSHPNYLGVTMLFGDLEKERFERTYDLYKALDVAAQHIIAGLGAVDVAELYAAPRSSHCGFARFCALSTGATPTPQLGSRRAMPCNRHTTLGSERLFNISRQLLVLKREVRQLVAEKLVRCLGAVSRSSRALSR
jgi:hypothetical protein